MSFPRGSRGRGGRGNKDWRGGARNETWAPKPSTKPLGPTIDSIDIKVLLIEEDSPEIENIEYVASYNWLDCKTPTILVPGGPPAWTPPVEDVQLKQDSGAVFRDINAAHWPSFPFEAALRSIIALQPNFDLQTLDIIGCGSTFGSLLNFAGSQPKPFRFDVDVIGDTVFFVRRGDSPTELIEDLRGYGHTFPEIYTSWDTETRGSVSHQRIIQYDFGGLRLLVRTETDGYVKNSKCSVTKVAAIQPPLEDAFDAMAVAGNTTVTDHKLQLKMQGHAPAQDQIFDIKTRAEQNIFSMEDILPRLWVNQTSKFLLAYHRYGLFDHPGVKDVKQLVAKWQQENSTLLGRFHAIVKRVVDVARDSEEPRLEVSWDGQGPMLITKQIGTSRRALPADLSRHWG